MASSANLNVAEQTIAVDTNDYNESVLKRKLEENQRSEVDETKKLKLSPTSSSKESVTFNVRARLDELQNHPNYCGWRLIKNIAIELFSIEDEMAIDVLNRFQSSDPKSIRNKDAYMKGIIHHVKHEWAIGKCGPGKTPNLTTPPDYEHPCVIQTLEHLLTSGKLSNPVDMRIRTLLSELPKLLAEKVMDNFKHADFKSINNPNGYLRSIIRMAEREGQDDPTYRLPAVTKNRLDVLASEHRLQYGKVIHPDTQAQFENLPDFVQLLLIEKFSTAACRDQHSQDQLLKEWIQRYREENPWLEMFHHDSQMKAKLKQDSATHAGISPMFGYLPPMSIIKVAAQ